jgi:ribA/ribD-fused uncharacterized protein
MESIITNPVIVGLTQFIDIAKKDHKAEFECKLLCGKIQTKDVYDRLFNTIQTLSIGSVSEEHRMTFSYADCTRVHVEGPQNIYKLVSSNSFRGMAVDVERKQRYYEGTVGKVDMYDVPEVSSRFTLRSESKLRKDWEGNPNDPKTHVRMIHRKSFKTASELFRIDFSVVKSRGVNVKYNLKTLLKQPVSYELEIEFVGKDTKIDSQLIVDDLLKIMTAISQSYYRTPFLLAVSDMQRYSQEFKMSGVCFYNPVTMLRRHMTTSSPHNISKGYTVTNKADGERSGLYVSRDRKLLKITPTNQITWTGVTAIDDSHAGDFVDGEYIADKQLFCIFDIYRFRNRDTKSLPLMKTDEDIIKNPQSSRLGMAKLFVEDLKSQFTTLPSLTPLRVETKLFLAGDGSSMEEAIRTILDTQFEYETDGLIFTPRASGVAPSEDRKGKTWSRVYKWKPANMNSIDFLLNITDEETLDPITKNIGKKGELYVSRTPGDDIIYPRETMTGEYVEKELPESLKKVAATNIRIPSIFQPAVPRDPDAYQILVPVNDKGLPVDKTGTRVETNTIVECSFDTDIRRWTILRTRYDKTYQYLVLKEPQYGNDIFVANSIWTSMHVSISEEMLKNFVTSPPDDTFEDDMYYRDDLKRGCRVFNDVYNFHNRIKDELYRSNIQKGDTLLELAVGRGGDLYKWKKTEPSKVVGVDISLGNITSPTQGSAVRYLNDRRKNPYDYMPAILYLQGDMTVYPLLEQEDKYMPILTGKEQPSTEYLEKFRDLNKFDDISCQFALHYACESEETFRNFAKNIEKYGKNMFFGTCLDGKAVYSLLMGKKTHLFGDDKQVCGEISKQYEDRESWVEEFGMPIRVFLESFDKPEVEYLVPFNRVVEIMKEVNYELQESKMFSELYQNQNGITLTQEQQVFSFLNRTFIFRKLKRSEREQEQEQEPEPEKEVEAVVEVEEEPFTEVVSKKTKKLKKEVEPEPVLFSTGDESGGPYSSFSNSSNHAVDIDGVRYPTVTHYIVAMKAREIKNDDMYTKIMGTATPKAVKALEKKITITAEEWDPKKDEIMAKAVRAKFTQYPELRSKLLETGEKQIGNADARETYWGIGTSMDTDKARVPSKWRGQNKLGKILMDLRKTLICESG